MPERLDRTGLGLYLLGSANGRASAAMAYYSPYVLPSLACIAPYNEPFGNYLYSNAGYKRCKDWMYTGRYSVPPIPRDIRSQLAQPFIYILVSAVDLFDAVHFGDAVCNECGEDVHHAGAQVAHH